MSLSKFKTAKAIWENLKQRYVQDSGALLHSLMQQTHVIEQNDMSIDEYYSAFDRLMGSLTSNKRTRFSRWWKRTTAAVTTAISNSFLKVVEEDYCCCPQRTV
jgi:hypothetical protein